MAKTVRDVMNHECFTLGVNDEVKQALSGLIAFGVTGAPVLDAAGQVLGVVSLMDLVELDGKEHVGEHMSAPAITTDADASLEKAARALVTRNVHRLAVVDASGEICGVVSATDLLRGLLDLPPRHPRAFPGLDLDPAVAFGNETRLLTEEISSAPDGPGVLVLVHHARGDAETIVWAEEASNVRTRLYELGDSPDGCTTRGPDHQGSRAPLLPRRERAPRRAEERRRATAARTGGELLGAALARARARSTSPALLASLGHLRCHAPTNCWTRSRPTRERSSCVDVGSGIF